eukprot:TRINITY_DN26408_c0_g1_i1.p1 TRINITY_DN26408_c0_g1~~TRINITY_DN26408_c0_g1_i1.p1  ORF type:complete len:159 (-),score=24.87 TRINITY_DN26408_c0_g1_i1:152-628(-)
MARVAALATGLGPIRLVLRPDAAPKTAEHFCKIINERLYDNCCFYRSDFVIQGGLQRLDGSGVANPHPDLPVNETKAGPRVTNDRGTVAFGHWDVPDNGNSEFFINLQHNPHLDDAYGGYCVFAQIDPSDAESFRTVDAIAQSIKQGQKVGIASIRLE